MSSTIWDDDPTEHRVFGVPAVLTSSEVVSLKADLHYLWRCSYLQDPGDLDVDLDLVRKFFDPVARGQTLRDRLSDVEELPRDAYSRLARYGEPLVIVVSSDVLLAGVEARLMLALLTISPGRSSSVISQVHINTAERTAMNVYRSLSTKRLKQVIDLRRLRSGSDPGYRCRPGSCTASQSIGHLRAGDHTMGQGGSRGSRCRRRFVQCRRPVR